MDNAETKGNGVPFQDRKGKRGNETSTPAPARTDGAGRTHPDNLKSKRCQRADLHFARRRQASTRNAKHQQRARAHTHTHTHARARARARANA
eukprot:4389895-Alexandrium_andersonii.AAC.1